jgi:hypothetical protein
VARKRNDAVLHRGLDSIFVYCVLAARCHKGGERQVRMARSLPIEVQSNQELRTKLTSNATP